MHQGDKEARFQTQGHSIHTDHAPPVSGKWTGGRDEGWMRVSSMKDSGLCEQNTLTRHIFSCFVALISMSHMTLAQDGCPHHFIHISCALSGCAF